MIKELTPPDLEKEIESLSRIRGNEFSEINENIDLQKNVINEKNIQVYLENAKLENVLSQNGNRMELENIEETIVKNTFNSERIQNYLENTKLSDVVKEVPNLELEVQIRNKELAGKKHPETGIPFNLEGLPVFDEVTRYEYQLQPENIFESNGKQFKECNGALKEAIQTNPELRAQFSEKQIAQIEAGKTPEGYVWHHDGRYPGKMQLVNREIHEKTGHTGKKLWMASQ